MNGLQERIAAEEVEIKVRRGISLDPEDDRIAQELAERFHGGNISRLIRFLLRDEWAEKREAVAS